MYLPYYNAINLIDVPAKIELLDSDDSYGSFHQSALTARLTRERMPPHGTGQRLPNLDANANIIVFW